MLYSGSGMYSTVGGWEGEREKLSTKNVYTQKKGTLTIYAPKIYTAQVRNVFDAGRYTLRGQVGGGSALWNVIEPIGECHLGPKKLEIWYIIRFLSTYVLYTVITYNNICAAGFALLNLPKGKSLGRSKPATNS